MSKPVTHFGWKRIDGLTLSPCVDLPLLKGHCRLPTDPAYTEHDALLTKYVNSAERLIEDQAEICIRPKQFEHWVSQLPSYCDNYAKGLPSGLSALRLEKPPVASVTWVKYWDGDNTQQTLDSDCYSLIDDASPPLLVFDTGHDLYPNDLSDSKLDLWRILMTLGSDDIPETAVMGMMILAAYYFRHPEDDGKVPPVHTNEARVFRDVVDSLRWRVYP